MADIQYLNYGNQQIEQQALLNNLANQVQGYVQQQPWSNKRKEKFMSAYSDIMNRGIIGASNNTGQWMIDVNGSPIPFDSMPKKDKEMYQEAAYFIQQQMAGLPTKAAEEEKKVEDKSKLPVFNNEYFVKEFGNHISNNKFGGRPIDTQTDWNSLDKRDETTGLRGRTERAKILANMLQTYSDSLDESKLNFEGSPFKDLNDFKTRINTAITKLNDGTWNQDDTDALNAIGLRASDWFNNGSGDIADEEGHTYAQLAALNQQALNEKAKQEAAEAEAKKKINSGVLTPLNGIHAVEARDQSPAYAEHLGKTYGVGQQGFNAINTTIQGLIEKGYNNGKGGGLNNAEKKQLGNLLYYIRQNNPNYQGLGNGQKTNVTLEEFEELKKFQSFGESNIKNMVRLPWQTSDGRYTYADSKGNVYFLKPTNQKKFNAPAINRSKEYYNYKNNFLRGNEPGAYHSRNLTGENSNWETEDYARITAALGDIISLGGFAANVGGSAISLIADTTADIADENLSKWDVGKNLIRNLGWTAAGFIPGGKLGKIGKNLQRWAPKLLVMLNNYNLLNDESNKKTWDRIVSGKMFQEGLNSEDLKNISYWTRALTGNINTVKATARDYKYSKARGTSGQEFTTKDGSKVTLSNKDVQEINVTGARKGQKAAEELFKSKTGKDVSDNTFKFSENGRKGIFRNIRSKLQDQQLQGKSTVFRTPEQQKRYDLLKQDRTKGGYAGWRPFWQRGTSSYFDHFNNGFSFRNPLRGIGQRLDPYRNIVSSETPKTTSQNSTNVNQNSVRTLEGPTPEQYRQSQVGRTNPAVKNTSELPENVKFNKEAMNNYKNMINGNFSNNELQSSSYNLTGTPLQVVKQSDGTFSVLFKGNVIANERNQREIQKTIRDLIKNTVQQGKSNSSSKISAKEMGKLLKEFKSKGWLKQGGTIDKQRIQQYKEYITK